jgi:hypothetical protein
MSPNLMIRFHGTARGGVTGAPVGGVWRGRSVGHLKVVGSVCGSGLTGVVKSGEAGDRNRGGTKRQDIGMVVLKCHLMFFIRCLVPPASCFLVVLSLP